MPRLACSSETCNYVNWNNPVPVMAAIVEYEGKVLLARNVAWPPKWFALVTGFLEAGESPEEGVLREVKEETNLEGTIESLVGVYPFKRMNQLIVVYHIKAKGEIILDEEELAEYKLVELEDLKPWPGGTGTGLRDWLRTKGIEKEFIKFPTK